MLKLAHEKNTINMVNDQWSSPTSTKTLVIAIQEIVTRLSYQHSPEIYGTYHVACNGKTNWYDYSIKILSALNSLGIETLLRKENIFPVSSKEYFPKVLRPRYSVLATKKYSKTFMFEFPNWENEINATILELI
jgi:dTDP-4-dehydrorhamnose reductase